MPEPVAAPVVTEEPVVAKPKGEPAVKRIEPNVVRPSRGPAVAEVEEEGEAPSKVKRASVRAPAKPLAQDLSAIAVKLSCAITNERLLKD